LYGGKNAVLLFLIMLIANWQLATLIVLSLSHGTNLLLVLNQENKRFKQ